MDNQNDEDDQMDRQDENRCCSVIATSATRLRLINGSPRDKSFNPFTGSIDPGRRFIRQKMQGFGSIDVVSGKGSLIISTPWTQNHLHHRGGRIRLGRYQLEL